jgi:hypothetical protein
VTTRQAPVIDFPDFNTDSSQQSLARFIEENNLITLVLQQGAFIVNDQKGKYWACQVLTFQLNVMVFRFSNTQLPRLDKLLFLEELDQMEE